MSVVGYLFAAAVLGTFGNASAAIINLPAVTFQARGAGNDADSNTLDFLANGGGAEIYYSQVPALPISEFICKVSLYARDFDGGHDVAARLMRKKLAAGVGVGFGPSAQTMATVATSGFDADTQLVATEAVSFRKVAGAFIYWVEVEFTGGFTEALAVRITTAPTC